MALPITASIFWLAAAVVLAYTVAGLAARRTATQREALDDLVGTTVLWALLGSRLIYAVLDPAATVRQPVRVLLLKGVISEWGAVGGVVAALAYLVWKRRLHAANRNGAILILASIMPPLMLAWNPRGVPSIPLLAILGETYAVSWYYAVAAAAIAAVLWFRPEQLTFRFTLLVGTALLIVDNFRAAPLLFGAVTSLQLLGAAMVSLAVMGATSAGRRP